MVMIETLRALARKGRDAVSARVAAAEPFQPIAIALADIGGRLRRRDQHRPAGIDQRLLDDVGMRLIDDPIRAAEHHQIEEAGAAGDQGRGIADLLAPGRQRPRSSRASPATARR